MEGLTDLGVEALKEREAALAFRVGVDIDLCCFEVGLVWRVFGVHLLGRRLLPHHRLIHLPLQRHPPPQSQAPIPLSTRRTANTALPNPTQAI